MVGVPDRRMAGTQTQQPDEPGIFGELRAAEARHAKGRETREELRRSRHECERKGSGLHPKGSGKTEKDVARDGHQCPGLQRDPIRPGLPLTKPCLCLVQCSGVGSFIHLFIQMHTRSLTLRSPQPKGGDTQKEAYVILQCDADRL